MKLTNSHNLPDSIFRAVENDLYDPGDSDITTTQLIDPPQMISLKKKYDDQLIEDASSRIWSVVGSCIHGIIERATNDKCIVESRFYHTFNGWKVSGKIDMISGGILYDYKVTSVWNYIYNDKKQYENQGNVNRFLCGKNGQEIEAMKNILILRDWIKSKADKVLPGDAYPKVQIVEIDLPVWSLEGSEYWISQQVSMHQNAQKCDDMELAQRYPCSDKDRWFNKRTGKYARCEGYCAVSRFCKQYQGAK